MAKAVRVLNDTFNEKLRLLGGELLKKKDEILTSPSLILLNKPSLSTIEILYYTIYFHS